MVEAGEEVGDAGLDVGRGGGRVREGAERGPGTRARCVECQDHLLCVVEVVGPECLDVVVSVDDAVKNKPRDA